MPCLLLGLALTVGLLSGMSASASNLLFETEFQISYADDTTTHPRGEHPTPTSSHSHITCSTSVFIACDFVDPSPGKVSTRHALVLRKLPDTRGMAPETGPPKIQL